MKVPVIWSVIWALVIAIATPALLGQDCGARWLPGQAYPGVYGTVRAIARLPNGSIVVGGELQFAGSTPVQNVALWDGSEWHAMGAGLPARVNALAVLADGSVIAGGAFFGLPANGGNRLARWDGTSWHEYAGGVSHEVNALHVLPNGNLAATGYFTSAGSIIVNRVAIWNGSTWQALGSGLAGGIGWALTSLSTGELVVSGDFTSADGAQTRYIAKWDGQAWIALGSGLDFPAYALGTAANGDVWAGSLGLWRWNGTNWQSVGGSFRNSSYGVFAASLAVMSNGDVIVGGGFDTVGALPVSGLARWNGTAWSAIQGSAMSVNTISPLSASSFYVGGSFLGSAAGLGANIGLYSENSWQQLGTARCASVAALTQLPNGTVVGSANFVPIGTNPPFGQMGIWNGHAWTPYLPGLNNASVLSVLADGSLVAAGQGTPTSSYFVSRRSGSGWTSLGSAPNGPVKGISPLPGGGLVAVGDFWTIGGVSAVHVAKWNGSAWSSLGPGIRGTCECIAALPNGDIAVGGDFTGADGDQVMRIARWNGQTWTTIGGGTNGRVVAMTVMGDGKLLITGSFTSAGGVPVNRVATYDGTAWQPCGSGLAWPGHSDVFGNRATTTTAGDAVVSGAFSMAGGQAANYVARWDGHVWSPLGAGLDTAPNCVFATASGELLFGGATYAGGSFSPGFARFAPMTSLRWAIQPADTTSDCGHDAVISATTAAGFAVTLCTWTKDGDPIDLSDGRHTASFDNDTATLVIHGTVLGDAGAYRCTTTNQCAIVQTNPAQLSVLGQVCCPADVGRTSGGPGSDGTLDNNDFIAFIAMFFNHVSAADRGVAGGIPGQDGQFDNNDFIVFINQFFVGC